MTSSLSHVPLTLEFRRSCWAAAWLSLLGAMSMSACWILPWPAWTAVLVSVLLVVWYWWAMRRHALMRGPVSAVRWSRDGWQVARDDCWQPATLLAATVWPPMVMLRLSSAGGAVNCWLPPGRVGAQQLRQLRVILKHGSIAAAPVSEPLL